MSKKKKDLISSDKQFVFNSDNILEIIEKQNQGFALPRYMNPWFKNTIGVRKNGCVYGWTQHEFDEFTKCAIDINYFANNYCHIKTEDGQVRQMKLRDYQYGVLDSYTRNRFTINMSSRQTGKCIHGDSYICISRDKGITYSIIKIKELITNIETDIINIPNYDGNILNKMVVNETILNTHVLTITGWVKLNELNITKKMSTYSIFLDNGEFIETADLHLVMGINGWVAVSTLKIGDKIMTGSNYTTVTNIVYNEIKKELYDISTESGDYLSTGVYKDNIEDFIKSSILNHNTITAAISLLHYCIFNTNKGVMVVANKSDTVIEILDKIKNIYKLLPFFMKPGIINWNSRSIVFDNGCRIKSSARTKEPAIGFTIDYLYMDEFAHIPSTIVNQYYKAAVPTVSSIKGSKIVITSTPNGANLFKELVIGAMLPDDHADRNMYKLIKVYWHQVPDGKFDDGTLGTRFDAKIYPIDSIMKELNLTINDIMDELKKHKFKYVKETETTDTGDKYFIRVLHQEGVSDIDTIRNLRLGKYNFVKFSFITNWKEQETKLINGEENFNQEYNIQFIAGSKRVLSANKAKDLDLRNTKYKHHEIDILDKRLTFEYDKLRWAPDYIEHERNNYYWVSALDISEGLGQDDSVINLFRLMARSDEWLKENKIKNMFEAFYLKQTGIYNYNRIDPEYELPELFYLLHFEYLNPQRCKSVVEYNGPGSTFLASLSKVFGGNNLYGNFIFTRFKHNVEDTKRKVGLKITRNKKLLVKKYITCIEKDAIYVDENETLDQMDNFIKVATRSGDYTYKADSGHDDIVMTEVGLSTYFDTVDYQNMCNLYYNELPTSTQKLIDAALNLDYNPDVVSYKAVSSALAKSRKNKMLQNNIKNFRN